MNGCSLSDYASLAQTLLVIITTVGIIASLWLSVRALREVQMDRQLRQMPHLAFETRGEEIRVQFVKAGKTIPGINPPYVMKMFPNLPADAEAVRIWYEQNQDGSIRGGFYGLLQNFGTGPALSTRVTWDARTISIGNEQFVIDEKKRLEPLYRAELNAMPTIPTHISPGGKARLSRLPTFIDKDYEKKITRVDGILLIECQDVFGKRHTAKQQFYLFTNYKPTPPTVHVTFGELVRDVDD